MTEVLRIERQGHFWVGVMRKTRDGDTVAHGAMHVQFQIPAQSRRKRSLVMVHGGGGQGLDFLTTPDGRSGWAEFFLRIGYDVYVVDRSGMGRSPHDPTVDGAFAPSATYEHMGALMFDTKNGPDPWPQARLHTQWPEGADVVDQFMASQGPFPATLATAQEDMRRCGVELLERIGPAILLTTSMGAPFGWLVADARPDLVEAIVAVEPLGPPFLDMGPLGKLEWGLTAIPLNYEPSPSLASTAPLRTQPYAAARPEWTDCLVQAEPARQLPGLSQCPIAVVTGEASWMARTNHAIAYYLAQAGAYVEHLRLEELGIFGNGHLMMLEKNSDEVAGVIANWIERRCGPAEIKSDAGHQAS